MEETGWRSRGPKVPTCVAIVLCHQQDSGDRVASPCAGSGWEPIGPDERGGAWTALIRGPLVLADVGPSPLNPAPDPARL
jgi:hypothetical protein